MAILENCICIAQARVIAGFKREPHVCTIFYQEHTNSFGRICIPFHRNMPPPVSRWTRFNAEVTKDGLGNDTRGESWNLVKMLDRQKNALTPKQRNELHVKILANYKYETELNEAKDSIGILIPIPESLRFVREHLSARDPKDAKELERLQMLSSKDIWYPPYKVKVSGQFRKEGVLKTFNKQLLAWDVYEALRQQEEGIDRDPFAAIDKYKHPYFITGNLASKRRAFMVVAVLSAPQGALNMAFNQQLAFA